MAVVGTAEFAKAYDLNRLKRVETISCNRILMTPFRPDHIFVSDRRPYIEEIKNGNYEKWADKLNIWISRTVFDPKIPCHGVPAQPRPKFRFKEWHVGVASTPMNWRSLDGKLCSFANTGLAMLQAAVIMGAKRIGIVGIGIVKPALHGETRHLYDDKADHWFKPTDESPKATVDCCHRAKKELAALGVEVCNLSPEGTNEVFTEIFGRYDFDMFVEEIERSA